MSERAGVEIDYCPECRGVWLDRGELDKILDRAQAESVPSAPSVSPTPAPAAPPHRDYDERERRYDDRDRRYESQGGYKRKKKEHWLEELFG